MIFARLGLNIEIDQGLICNSIKKRYAGEDTFNNKWLIKLNNFIRKPSVITDGTATLSGINRAF